jgi:hypothetical protein
MSKSGKKRFSVTLGNSEYEALKRIADSQNPPLSLQYVVAFALTEFITKHQSSQFELDLKNRP